MVTYKFDYVVDGRTYTNEATTDKLPATDFEVTYLPGKPEVAFRGNACATYENIINNQGSPTLMYLGIGLFFVGIVVGYNGLKSVIRRR